jgi:hypothetical protein
LPSTTTQFYVDSNIAQSPKPKLTFTPSPSPSLTPTPSSGPSSSPSPSPTQQPTTEPIQTASPPPITDHVPNYPLILQLGIIAVLAVAALGILVYFKKTKKWK